MDSSIIIDHFDVCRGKIFDQFKGKTKRNEFLFQQGVEGDWWVIVGGRERMERNSNGDGCTERVSLADSSVEL